MPDIDYGAVDDMVTAELGALFRIERPLKHGRASHVYFARDVSGGGGRETALKVIVLPAGIAPEEATRFQQAAQTAAGLDHPNIARPYRHGTTDTLWWYAMDYVPAPSIAERLAAGKGRPLDVPLTWRIALQIASALDYAHRRGIMHGALKPTDVLLDDAGWVRVVDTGLAQATRLVAGAEDVGPLADQYSLALIVRECLTGTPPQGGAGKAEGLPPGAGPRAAQALQRALAQTPGDRFAGVLEFVAALTGGEPQAFGLAPHSPPRGAPRPILLFDSEQPPPRRLYRLGVALTVAAGGGVLWLAAQSGQPPSNDSVPTRTPERVAVAPVAPVTPEPPPTVPPAPVETAAPAARTAPTRPAHPRRTATAERAPGYLSVSARPWALLSIDGRLIGNTPRIKVRLAPGMHRFRLQRAGFKTYEAAVEVKPGETVSITNITLTATAP